MTKYDRARVKLSKTVDALRVQFTFFEVVGFLIDYANQQEAGAEEFAQRQAWRQQAKRLGRYLNEEVSK